MSIREAQRDEYRVDVDRPGGAQRKRDGERFGRVGEMTVMEARTLAHEDRGLMHSVSRPVAYLPRTLQHRMVRRCFFRSARGQYQHAGDLCRHVAQILEGWMGFDHVARRPVVDHAPIVQRKGRRVCTRRPFVSFVRCEKFFVPFVFRSRTAR